MSDLLADLLGSTLVDAQPELKSAWRSVLAQGRPPQAEAFLTEPPPWPPASVVSLLSDRLSKPASAAMIETLVEQLASNPAAQAWLNESWRKPVRHVDRSLLDDIGLVAQGRLESDPLFRRWLRAEWTAWARQRYRRVERVVKGRWSPTSVSLKAQSH